MFYYQMQKLLYDLFSSRPQKKHRIEQFKLIYLYGIEYMGVTYGETPCEVEDIVGIGYNSC